MAAPAVSCSLPRHPLLYTLKDCGVIPNSRLQNHLIRHTSASNRRGALIYISARGVAVRRLEIVRCNIRGFFEKRQAPTAPTPWASWFRNLWGLTGARIRSLKWTTGPYLPSPMFCFRPSCVNVYPSATPHSCRTPFTLLEVDTRICLENKGVAGKEGRGSRAWLGGLIHLELHIWHHSQRRRHKYLTCGNVPTEPTYFFIIIF